MVLFDGYLPDHGVVAWTSALHMDTFQGAPSAIKAFAHLSANPALVHVAEHGARLTHL